ncbi:helix-turn-helix domain-containing protein [Hydrogenophaga sp.]
METSTAPAEEILALSGPRVDGNFVRKLREELKMSQKEFAEYLGLSPGTVATWERRNKLSAAAAILVREVDKRTASQRKSFNSVISEGIGRPSESH